MRINHNITALNTYRQFNNANNAQSKSMEKLSSGLRINSAADDAAGLAISEKMRGQIRGLDQASKNSQDGISMIQTAEGALNETHDILQRMRELATQASNDTNVGTDRTEIQKEINQLSSEINRIGNTTEFNTKSLLKGDGKASLTSTGLAGVAGKLANGADATTIEAKRTDTAVAGTFNAAGSLAYTINGETLTIDFDADGTAGTTAAYKTDSATSNSAIVEFGSGSLAGGTLGSSIGDALQSMIDKNDTLKGNYKVTSSGTDGKFTIEAVKGGAYEGAKGNISGPTVTTSTTPTADASPIVGKDVAAVKATKEIDFNSLVGTGGTAVADTDANIKALVEKGMTINGKQIEFYNANDGAYTGDAIGVNISTALAAGTANGKVDELVKNIATQISKNIDGVELTQKGNTSGSTAQVLVISAAVGGDAGENIEVKDGGVQEDFKATFQVGANKDQSFTIDIKDMRSSALGITGKVGDKGFTSSDSVTDGTSSTNKEAALDVSSFESATSAIDKINSAIEKVSSERSKLGAFQNRLEHTINNLNTSSENLTSAESRIRDVDYALAA